MWPTQSQEEGGELNNPYPETIQVANDKHKVWNEGYQAGIKEVTGYIKKNITIPYPVGSVGYIGWQAKLKKWGIK